ncbi:uncharacterized protein LOC143216261 isoform X2 [Lasioglossum baleicum]|uniref:uncharacterized protein LOC143216261 isoform X2 n=1 Tax=Lasioglossum baleicum TaxID=434251 RepID=UPI003FCD698E
MGNSDSKAENKESNSEAPRRPSPVVPSLIDFTVPDGNMGNSDSKAENKQSKSEALRRPSPIVTSIAPLRRAPIVPSIAPRRPAPIVPSVAPPQPFLTMNDFSENWRLWKQTFLQYKASIEGSTQTDWENTLLNLMGPIGQEIYTVIKSRYQRMNLTMLLKEFDEYSVFAAKRRLPRESIYEYMDDLQAIVRNKNLPNGEDRIKDRIWVEINESEFTNAAKKLIPTFEFSSAYKSLTLKQVAFLWDFYLTQNNCSKCGNEHTDSNSCPAIGKQCKKCNKFDHYTRRCPLSFLNNCRYCGGMHRFKQCPAYNEMCTKCNKPNHFYWKCQSIQILQCRFCGMSHSADRSICPAINSFCLYCNARGHFSSRCNNRPRRGRI